MPKCKPVTNAQMNIISQCTDERLISDNSLQSYCPYICQSAGSYVWHRLHLCLTCELDEKYFPSSLGMNKGHLPGSGTAESSDGFARCAIMSAGRLCKLKSQNLLCHLTAFPLYNVI